MAIALDNATVPPTSSLTFNHTVGTGAHRYLIVQVNLGPNTVSVASATYASVALTFLGHDNDTHTVELWGLQDPATGTNQVVITLTGSAGFAPAAISFAASNPITPATAATAHGSDAAPTVTVTGSLGDLIVGGVVAASDATLTFGEIELWNDEEGDAGAAFVATGQAQQLSWALVTPGAWGIVAVPLHETAAPVLTETSTIPGFQDAFVATVGALPAFTGVPITIGAPDGPFSSTMVALGDVTIDEQPVFLGTIQKRDESYEQSLYISVVNEGTSQSDPRSDAFLLRDAIAGQLKTDPTMGGTVNTAIMGGGQLRQPSNPTRREAVLRLVIRCKARI